MQALAIQLLSAPLSILLCLGLATMGSAPGIWGLAWGQGAVDGGLSLVLGLPWWWWIIQLGFWPLLLTGLLGGFSPMLAAGAFLLLLLVYGASVAFGNIWGGRLADRLGPIPALRRLFAGLALVLLLLTVTAHSAWLAALTVLIWGAFAFGNVPALQVRVVQQAERYAPAAVDVASGLNIAAFNIGIALGSVVGGLTVEHLGLIHTPWIGALIVLLALALTRQKDGPALLNPCVR